MKKFVDFFIQYLNREINNVPQTFLFFFKRSLASKTVKYILHTETYIQLGFKDF